MLTKTCIDNIEGLSYSFGLLNVEDDSFGGCAKIVFGSNNVKKINRDIETIDAYCEDIETLIGVMKQITVPEASWVVSRLEEIADISGVEAVTPENNPDGLLDKEGGYTDCVYFSLHCIEQDSVPGDTIVGKGTDAGGAVEIYTTLEEAEARCEYLSGFDGTILYSGSYAIVGTMVIRTSYKLADVEQYELTNGITQKLTEID